MVGDAEAAVDRSCAQLPALASCPSRLGTMHADEHYLSRRLIARLDELCTDPFCPKCSSKPQPLIQIYLIIWQLLD